MKRLFTFLSAMSAVVFLFAQAPQTMSYQAVIRDASSYLVTNHSVGIRISILQGSSTGSPVFVETHSVYSNENGLVSLEIGGGTLVSGSFSTIDWSNGPYFLKTETDPNGSTSYTISGTTQLMSVPYALYAKTAENISGGITETDPDFNTSIAAGITGTDTANWNNKLDAEIDGDVTNELQILSISNDTIRLTNGGFVKLPASFSGDYNDLSNQPSIPTVPSNVSAFTNDAGYLTSEQDTFLWKRNGNVAYYNNGNVGIGTATPSSQFHLLGDMTIQDQNSSPFHIVFKDSLQQLRGEIHFNWADNATNFDFNVLIPDTTQRANYRFFRETNATGEKAVIFYKGNNTTETSAIIGVDGYNSYFQKHGGNFGIGTSNPVGKFQVNNDVDGFDSSFVILPNGYVGVGTLNPVTRLHLYSDYNGYDTLMVVQNVSTGTDAVSSIIIKNNNRIFSMGKLGENCTAWSGYGSPGESFIYNGQYSKGLNIICPDVTDGKIRFFVGTAANSTPKLIISNNGNVGVGTATPARTLHVSSVMRLEPIATAPASPGKGDMYFDSTINKLRVYDGTTWQNCW